MAPHFFIPEGAGSGICRDSALGGTAQSDGHEEGSPPLR